MTLSTFAITLIGFRNYILDRNEFSETELDLAVKFCDELTVLYQEFSQKLPTIFAENDGEQQQRTVTALKKYLLEKKHQNHSTSRLLAPKNAGRDGWAPKSQ